jgi:hypothetical protein
VGDDDSGEVSGDLDPRLVMSNRIGDDLGGEEAESLR